MKKNKALWIIVICCIVFGLAIPKMLMQRPEATQKPDGKSMAGKGAGAPMDAKAGKGMIAGRRNMNATVTIYVVKTRPIEDRIVSSGTIMANEQVELKSEASGRIEQLNIKEGTAVAKGRLLVKINDSDLQAQLLKAKAAYNLAKDRENRQKRLLEKEVISTEDYQTSQKELESNGADIELINAQIRKTEIRAPFDGIIGLRYVSEGAYVTSGTQIADLISLSPLKIEFSVPERYFGNVKPGTKLTFTIQASQKTYSAHVYAVEPKIDESTRTVTVRGFCENPDGNVAPGAFAKVELVLSTNNNAVVVPSEALVPDMVGQKVFRVSGGKALSSTVRTGIRTESMVEITQGLSAGDTIVTAGVLMLRPNMPVTISETAE